MALFHGTAAGCPTLFAVRRITLIIALARMMAQTMTRIIPMLRLMDVHRQEANSVLERPKSGGGGSHIAERARILRGRPLPGSFRPKPPKPKRSGLLA